MVGRVVKWVFIFLGVSAAVAELAAEVKLLVLQRMIDVRTTESDCETQFVASPSTIGERRCWLGDSWKAVAVTGLAAVVHFNNRDPTYVPEFANLTGCDKYLNVTVLDSGSMGSPSVNALLSQLGDSSTLLHVQVSLLTAFGTCGCHFDHPKCTAPALDDLPLNLPFQQALGGEPQSSTTFFKSMRNDGDVLPVDSIENSPADFGRHAAKAAVEELNFSYWASPQWASPHKVARSSAPMISCSEEEHVLDEPTWQLVIDRGDPKDGVASLPKGQAPLLCHAVASLALHATPDSCNDTETINTALVRSSVLGGFASGHFIFADTLHGEGVVFQLLNAGSVLTSAGVLSIMFGVIALISHAVLCLRDVLSGAIAAPKALVRSLSTCFSAKLGLDARLFMVLGMSALGLADREASRFMVVAALNLMALGGLPGATADQFTAPAEMEMPTMNAVVGRALSSSSEVTVSGGTWQSEVFWSLACEGLNSPITGGAPYSATHAVPPSNCMLEMYDSYGDGWNGNMWSAPDWTDQSFSLVSGFTASATFVVAVLPLMLHGRWLSEPPWPTFSVVAKSNCAEQNVATGLVSIGSSDLELPFDGRVEQLVGIVFPSIGLDASSDITNTYLVFDIDEVRAASSEPVTLRIFGEKSSNATQPSSAANDLSSRPRTTATVEWSPEASTDVQQLMYSPDISSIVQEIVGQMDWASGNPMAIMIERVSGNGSRWVESMITNHEYAQITSGPGVVPALENGAGPRMELGGAGLYINGGGVANLDGCQVYDNVAPWDNGGGFYVDDGGVANLDGCNVFSNEADRGGGLYVRQRGTANLDGCNVFDNQATYTGAGVYVSTGGVANLEGCNVFSNEAYEGGGLFIKGTATLTDTNVYTNQANGAGLYIYIEGTATLTSTNVYENVATVGAGLFVDGKATLITSKLSGNTAPGGANLNLYLDAGSSTTYVLPAPPGHWVPAIKCEVWREACPNGGSKCMPADCSTTPNQTTYNCLPATFNQPCNWQLSPELLGKFVYMLPLGAHNDDLPTACGLGLLGGEGSKSSEQTSGKCAGLCPAGFVCADKPTLELKRCEEGSFCPEGASVSLPCSEGTYSNASGLTSAEQCTATDPGFYAPTGSTEQVPCSPGTYAPDAGMASCQRCKAGTYQSDESATSCESCPKHSWCAAGSSAPTTCGSGTVGGGLGLTNQSECLPCPAGSWCSAGRAIPCGVNTFQPLLDQDYAGACQQCPEDAESLEASISIEACKCRAGYYDSKPAANEVACEVCTIGSSCPTVGTTTATLNITAGWYRTASYSADLRRCPDASNEETGCIGGIGDEGPCKPWLTGPYCRICNVTDGSRYYDPSISACVPCEGGSATTPLAILGAIIVVVVLLLIWWGWRKPYNRIPRQLRNRLHKMAHESLSAMRPPLKQMLAFYQIATRIPAVFRVSMPASVAALLDTFEGLNLNIDSMGLPLPCLQIGSFFDRLLFVVLMPYVIALLIIAWCTSSEALAASSTWLKGGLIRALPYLLGLSFLAFPMVSSLAFQVFNCETFDDGNSFLRADYSLDCNDTDEYGPVRVLAWAAIALYPLAIPLICLALLLSTRKAILTEQPTPLSRSLAFLHKDYEPHMFWWEIVEILKKLFLVGFCVKIRPGSTVQLVTAFAFSLVLLLMTAISEPYACRTTDYFAMLCNFSLVAVLFFCLVLQGGIVMEEVEGMLSDELQALHTYDPAQLSVALVCTLLASLIVAAMLAAYQMYRAAQTATRMARAEREAAEARGRLSQPPKVDWQLKEGNRYMSFLSHFKVEAGSDARYLSDLIRRMTGCPAYLDSTDLVDLRTLFNEGVHKTDVLFILATKSVFTRPWCLLEMWEAAVMRVPAVLFPVVGSGWTLEDTVTLLSDLMGQMEAHNPQCMPEVMEHVRKQGVSDVREVEDVLLAHLGLVPTLGRPGRPASIHLDKPHPWDLDIRLCARLNIDVTELGGWLAAQHARLEQQLQLLAWQSWGTDNQIIASVQTLLDQGAAAMGRSWPLEWKEDLAVDDQRSRTGALKKRLKVFWERMLKSGKVPLENDGHLLIVCDREESGGHLRLLQQQLGRQLQCEVLIGNGQVETWLNEVEGATRGVVLVQTKSVLRHPVRLLQLFECAHQRIPLVCINIVGAGYDFDSVKPLLRSLPTELSQVQVATLRTELAVRNHGVGQLSSSLIHTVTNAISVFLNPGAGEAMVDASIKDVIDKLPRARKLLRSNSIYFDVVFDKEQEAVMIQKHVRSFLARRELQRRRQVRKEEAHRKQEERATLVTKAGGEQVTNSNGKARAAESSSTASARAEVELVVSSPQGGPVVVAKPKSEKLTGSTSNSGAAGSSSMHASASAFS